MRSIFKLSLLAASMSLLAACGEKSNTENKPASDAISEVQAVAEMPSTELEKQSYSLGVSFGNYLRRALDENKKVKILLDTPMVLAGVRDSVSNSSKMTQEEIETVMKEFDTITRAKHAELAEKVKADVIKAGTDFLADNAKKDGVITTETGIQYKVVIMGDGAKPTVEDRVKVHYKGTLISGEEFDSSYARNEPAVFGVSQVISGWTEALQLMPVGSKSELTIPWELAYGERATGNIPPYSTL